jgi:polysaccharide biosynthesis/export protein
MIGRLLLGLPVFATVLLLAGCGAAGSSAALFPDRYPLGQLAQAQRQCNPVDLPRELNKAWIETYIIEPGDGLLVMPSDLDSKLRLPADQTVLPDGSIDLGKYGKLVVGGKSLAQIESDVYAAVRKKEKEEDVGFIDVRLVNRQSKVFYVFGEVTTSGKFPLVGNETAIDGIIAAGGLTDRSSWRDIILVRPTNDGPGQVLRVDYGAIIRTGSAATNYQLQPGDRIYVGSRNVIDLLFNTDRFK